MRSRAVFSDDRAYRYLLTRDWGEGPRATFVLLNPSTADEFVNDPTISKCIRFAKRWGLGGLNFVNVYALRSTDPKGLWRVDDPVGPENDWYLSEAAADGEQLIAAWGTHPKRERVEEVLALPGFERLLCLKTTKDGHPHHPLYLPESLTPILWPG